MLHRRGRETAYPVPRWFSMSVHTMSLPRCNRNGMHVRTRDTLDYGPSLGQTESGSVELPKDFALRGAQLLNSKLVPMTLDRTCGLKNKALRISKERMAQGVGCAR